jgi:hypothetical protein
LCQFPGTTSGKRTNDGSRFTVSLGDTSVTTSLAVATHSRFCLPSASLSATPAARGCSQAVPRWLIPTIPSFIYQELPVALRQLRHSLCCRANRRMCSHDSRSATWSQAESFGNFQRLFGSPLNRHRPLAAWSPLARVREIQLACRPIVDTLVDLSGAQAIPEQARLIDRLSRYKE